MKNYIAPGKVVSVITPEDTTYTSGKGYVVGSLFGIANLTTQEGQQNEFSLDGIYEFAGAGTLFAPAFYNATTGAFTGVSATGLYKIGVIVGVGTDTIEVRLNGVDVAPVPAAA